MSYLAPFLRFSAMIVENRRF